LVFINLVFLAILGQSTPVNVHTRSYQDAVGEGHAEYEKGHFANAEKLFSEALALFPPSDESARAKLLSNLGTTYSKQQEFSKAFKAFSESLSISKRLGDKDDCALMLQNLGMLYSRLGNNDEAIRFLNQAQEYIKSNPNPDARVVAGVLNGMGIVLFRRGNNGKAETYFNQALQAVSSPEIIFDRPGILNNLGAAYISQHNYKRAEEILRQALAVKEADYGLAHPDLTPTLCLLGMVDTATRRFDEAQDQYRRALRILEPQSSSQSVAIALILHALSITYLKANRIAERAAVLQEAAQIAQRNLDKEPEMPAILDEYSKLLRSQGKVNQADELHAEASRARAAAGLVVRTTSAFQ
jgi:tetratricopeptide (TPR) repeat protein